MGHKNLGQTYFRGGVSLAAVAKVYLEKCMEHLTFCDMSSLEKSQQEKIDELAKKDLIIAHTQNEMKEMKQRMDLMQKTTEDLQLFLRNQQKVKEILDK